MLYTVAPKWRRFLGCTTHRRRGADFVHATIEFSYLSFSTGDEDSTTDGSAFWNSPQNYSSVARLARQTWVSVINGVASVALSRGLRSTQREPM